MTFRIGRIQGGTNAGKKRPLLNPAEEWECDCPGEVVADGVTEAFVHPGWMLNCKWCGKRRPT